MSTFKDDLYRDYLATHVIPRKGSPSVEMFRAAARAYRRHFDGLLPADLAAPILDVGCGFGRLVWWLQDAGFAATEGVDLSAESIAMGQALGVQHLHHADGCAFLSSRPNRYAVIFLRDVLEHFGRADVMQLLALARTALVPGGRIVMQAPNGESPFFGRLRYGDFTHELAFAPSSAQQILRAAGFVDIAVRGCPPVAAGPRSWPRMLAWRLVQGLYRFLLWSENGQRHAVVTQNLIATARRPADAP